MLSESEQTYSIIIIFRYAIYRYIKIVASSRKFDRFNFNEIIIIISLKKNYILDT